jgi:thioredoxin-dependent peroxiredoxin
MAKLSIGDIAPDFNLANSQGQMISLKDFYNKNYVVLYFYPKDDTPGCTTEACGFRDTNKTIHTLDAIVVGISPDSVVLHEQFAAKFQLPFLLLSDVDAKVCQGYGVWVEKQNYGKKYMGVSRTTFIIDKKGVIVQIFEKVKPDGHAEEVLAFLKSLNSSKKG